MLVTAGYLFSLLLLRRLLVVEGIRAPTPLSIAAVAILGFGTYGVVLLRDPNVYTIAVGAAYCFFMAGGYYFTRALQAPTRAMGAALAAGLSIGLASGCRPHYALGAAPLSAVYIRARGGAAIWFLAPLSTCALILAWYNFARFGKPLEFGTTYQLTTLAATRGVSLHLSNIAQGLYYMLLAPPRRWDQFPYLIPQFVVSTPRQFVENATGLLALSPPALAGLALPLWGGRSRTARPNVSVLVALYTAAILLMLFIALTGFSAGRYLTDFAPSLLVVSLFGLLRYVVQRRGGLRYLGIAALTAGAIWTVIVGGALSLSLNDILRDRNPRLYERLASWCGQTAAGTRLPIEDLNMTATIRFSGEPRAIPEGILAVGRPGAEDCLTVEYIGENRVRFAERKSAAGTTLGLPLTIDPARDHRLNLHYSAMSQRLEVTLGDQMVLDTIPWTKSRSTAVRGPLRKCNPYPRPYDRSKLN